MAEKLNTWSELDHLSSSKIFKIAHLPHTVFEDGQVVGRFKHLQAALEYASQNYADPSDLVFLTIEEPDVTPASHS